MNRAGALLAVASCCFAARAQAHDLTCTKTVGGGSVERVDRYPTTLHYRLTLTNELSSVVSIGRTVTDPLLAPFGFAFNPAPPVSVPPGGSVSSTFDLKVGSYEECLRIGDTDGRDDSNIDNALHVTFDQGQAMCTARVICLPPEQDAGPPPDAGVPPPDAGVPPPDAGVPPSDAGVPPSDAGVPPPQDAGVPPPQDAGVPPPPDAGVPPPDAGVPPPDAGAPPPQDAGVPPPQDGGQGTGATRTLGFFKNHEVALQDCLNFGPVDLGFITITTLVQAEGILYGSPNKFGNGTSRSALDMARFILGRQTLVGICNFRLFGTTPTPPSLLADAVATLAGTNCGTMGSLASQVDAYNNSGDAQPFPTGFVPGPSTPGDAQAIAVDPTTPSSQLCSP